MIFGIHNERSHWNLIHTTVLQSRNKRRRRRYKAWELIMKKPMLFYSFHNMVFNLKQGQAKATATNMILLLL